MARINTVTVAEFVTAITGITRGRFAGLSGCTIPRLTVKDRTTKEPWAVLFPGIDRANVRKIMHGAIMCGPDYNRMIELELAREGKAADEHVKGDTWHEGMPGVPCLRRHKKDHSRLYLWAAFVQKAQRPDGTWIHIKPRVRFVDISTGAEIERSRLVNFLDKDDLPTNQGVDSGREAIVRCYMLESVRTLTVDGISYVPIMK